MWYLGTWVSGGLVSARLTVALNDFKGLFLPKQFYDPMILSKMGTIQWERKQRILLFGLSLSHGGKCPEKAEAPTTLGNS